MTAPHPKNTPIADPLDLYAREVRKKDLLTPRQELRIIRRMVDVRDRWAATFLGRMSVLEALWQDLQSWRRGEMSARCLVAGPPRPRPGQRGPEESLDPLHRLFHEAMARGPLDGGAVQALVRAVLDVGLRGSALERYRSLAEETGSKRQIAAMHRAFAVFNRARRPLIEHNLRLPMKLAHDYVPGPIPYADLVQEGSLGLVRATETYNMRFGVKFITYAYPWVRQCIIRALENTSRVIRLPVGLTQRLRRLTNEQEEESKAGPDAAPTPAGLPYPLRALDDLTTSNPVFSLDLCDEDTGIPVVDLLSDPRSSSPADPITRRDTRCFMRSLLGLLPDRQGHVLKLRFGIGCSHSHTLGEIGAVLGISGERVRQIQRKAFRSLRKGPHAQVLEELLPVD